MSGTYRIVHLYADVGIEDEVLATFGEVVRVGIDPSPNPFSEVVRSDARRPPLEAGAFDLALVHHPCRRWSTSTHGTGNPDDHPDDLDRAREVADELADHWILENVPQAPLRDPVVLDGRMFGMPIRYRRAFETTFTVSEPAGRVDSVPLSGILGEQGGTGKQWVGDQRGWRLAKGYAHDWPRRDLKRHAVPAPYLRYLLRHWFDALEAGTRNEQTTLVAATDGGNSRYVDTATEHTGGER